MREDHKFPVRQVNFTRPEHRRSLLSSGLCGIGSSTLSSGASTSPIPLYHPTMSADDDYTLVPPPPPGPSTYHGHAAPSITRGNNGIPTMVEALYGMGQTMGGLGYDPCPPSSSAASSGNNNHAWLGWDQHPHSQQNPHHQRISQPDAFPQLHSHHHQHLGPQRITSRPVDLSGSGGVDGLGGGGGGGWLGIGASADFSLHDNSSYFTHAARRPWGAPITHSQPHGQTPSTSSTPPSRPYPHHHPHIYTPSITHYHEHEDVSLPHSQVGGQVLRARPPSDYEVVMVPMPMSSLALGMNLGLGKFVDGERESRTGIHKKWKMTCNQELPSDPQERIKKAVSRQGSSQARSTLPSASHFSGAQHCVSNGGTFNNIFGDYIAAAESSDAHSQTQSSNGIIEGSSVLSIEDVSIEREIYKGHGYRLHAAKMLGKIVAMKVYEGSRARERCSEAAKFNQKVIHPNIPQMIGVSPLKSDLSYLVFDGEYEGAVQDILGQALKKDLKEILTLGLQTVVGLSSGLDYLQDLKYPLASVGLDHFVILSRKGKPVISFDPDDPRQINQSDHRPGVSSSAEVVFHELCRRTFDNACKAHYESQQIQRAYADEFDINVNDLPENSLEELDSSGAPSSPTLGGPSSRISPQNLLPSGRRQELVWKSPTAEAVSLNDISHEFQNFLNAYLLSPKPSLHRRRGRYTARTAHRCPGYNRIEITLTANITRSAIVSHSSPIPHEICPVCKKVVKDTDVFNCICGGDDDESMPTIRCTSCSEWHHRPCVILLDVEPLTFVCERHPHSRGHALSMVGGMDMGAGADMDGTPPNPKFIPNTADDIGISIGIVNAPVVGVGAGGGGGVSGDTGRSSSASATASSETQQEFNNACGLMSLDDPNMGGGAKPDGEAFFSDPAQVSDAGDGESGKDSSKATPLAAGGYRKRVALFPSSKTPIVEREIGDMARGRGDDANHGITSAQKPQPSYSFSLPNPPFGDRNDVLDVPAKIKHEGSASPSIASSSRSSSCVVEDASDTTDSPRPSFKRLPSQTLGPKNVKRAFLGRGVGGSLALGGMSMGMGMAGFEANAMVDLDGGDGRYHHLPTQESAVVGTTRLSHLDRVVKSLVERRRVRRMSAPTSRSGVVGLGLVEGVGGGGGVGR